MYENQLSDARAAFHRLVGAQGPGGGHGRQTAERWWLRVLAAGHISRKEPARPAAAALRPLLLTNRSE